MVFKISIMKTKLIFLSIFFVALFSNEAYSQYGSNNINGVDRSIGSSVRQNKPTKRNEPKDYAETIVDYLNKELKLDGLQQAAVKTIINDNKGSIEEITAMDISYAEKKDKILVINDKIDKDILKLLSKEQSDKYLKMKEEREKKALRN